MLGAWRVPFLLGGEASPGDPQLSHFRCLFLGALMKLVRVIVLALDDLFLGRFPIPQELGRPANAVQMSCVKRLYAMFAACGPRPDEFRVVPGRSGSELIACLDILESFFEETQTFSSGYGDGSPVRFLISKQQVPDPDGCFPQLQPYRSNVYKSRTTGK